jgi:hypothetical protein
MAVRPKPRSRAGARGAVLERRAGGQSLDRVIWVGEAHHLRCRLGHAPAPGLPLASESAHASLSLPRSPAPSTSNTLVS